MADSIFLLQFLFSTFFFIFFPLSFFIFSQFSAIPIIFFFLFFFITIAELDNDGGRKQQESPRIVKDCLLLYNQQRSQPPEVNGWETEALEKIGLLKG